MLTSASNPWTVSQWPGKFAAQRRAIVGGIRWDHLDTHIQIWKTEYTVTQSHYVFFSWSYKFTLPGYIVISLTFSSTPASFNYYISVSFDILVHSNLLCYSLVNPHTSSKCQWSSSILASHYIIWSLPGGSLQSRVAYHKGLSQWHTSSLSWTSYLFTIFQWKNQSFALEATIFEIGWLADSKTEVSSL